LLKKVSLALDAQKRHSAAIASRPQRLDRVHEKQTQSERRGAIEGGQLPPISSRGGAPGNARVGVQDPQSTKRPNLCVSSFRTLGANENGWEKKLGSHDEKGGRGIAYGRRMGGLLSKNKRKKGDFQGSTGGRSALAMKSEP